MHGVRFCKASGVALANCLRYFSETLPLRCLEGGHYRAFFHTESEYICISFPSIFGTIWGSMGDPRLPRGLQKRTDGVRAVSGSTFHRLNPTWGWGHGRPPIWAPLLRRRWLRPTEMRERTRADGGIGTATYKECLPVLCRFVATACTLSRLAALAGRDWLPRPAGCAGRPAVLGSPALPPNSS